MPEKKGVGSLGERNLLKPCRCLEVLGSPGPLVKETYDCPQPSRGECSPNKMPGLQNAAFRVLEGP